MKYFLLALVSCCVHVCSLWREDAILGAREDEFPAGHLKYFKSSTETEEVCQAQGKDCDKNIKKKSCWGYEEGCVEGKDFQYPKCSQSRFPSMKEQQKVFWEQGDFGYVKKRLDSMQVFCKPEKKESGSLLECSENWEICRARNLFLDLRKRKFEGTDRYIKDFFGKDEIGGSCIGVNKDAMKKIPRFNGELNSWNADLRNYTPMKTLKKKCDVIIKKPTIFMKLDSGVNLYHHFCDFLNLYAAQHINGSFSTDVNIVIWDTSNSNYFDLFEDTWGVFSKHKRKNLAEFKGKRVCFRDAVFSLLPRMIFGLYYNAPIERNCHGTRLFQAFSEHLVHRLGIQQDDYDEDVVRVTLLKRSTKYRKILNEDELIGAMMRVDRLNVTAVDYAYREMPFLEQIKRSHNTDILIGMHGAGLTHMLFQPNWGAVFEIYNTEDPDCYRDLANLRGVEYFTWENKELLFQQDKGHHPKLGEHPKFTNYAFNVDEFMRILTKAIKGVLKRRTERSQEKCATSDDHQMKFDEEMKR